MDIIRDKPFKSVLFDKDGTLFDFHATWSSWMTRTLELFTRGDQDVAHHLGKQLGFDTKKGEFQPNSIFVSGTPKLCLQIFQRQFPKMTLNEINQILNDSSLQTIPVPVVPLKPLLSKLRHRDLCIGVVTNDSKSSAELHLETAGCLEEFDVLVGSDCGLIGKPAPDMLLASSSEMGVNPKDCFMVGDSTVDMLAAHRAGMSAIAVLTGVETEEDLAPLADVVLKNIGEIPEWLDTN